jgi:S-DNA-T family DNA segregation ATPase FtsK/SpoIIIE
VTVTYDVRQAATAASTDLILEIEPDACVGDLVVALAQRAGIEPRSGLALLRTLLHYAGAPDELAFGYLPNDAAIGDCALHDGVELTLADPVQRYAPTLNIDRERSDSDLFLVDLRGPNRGRVTRLPVGEKITVGSAPPGPRRVLLDDRDICAHAVTVTNRDGGVADCRVEDATTLVVNGAAASAGTYELLPGAIVTFRRDEPGLEKTDFASIALTTQAGLHGRSPAGKIQFDMTARLAERGYPPLPANLAQITPQPDPPEPQPLAWEQVVIPVAIGFGIYAFSHSIIALVITPLTAAIPLVLHRRQRQTAERRFHKARAAWVDRLGLIDDALARLAGNETKNLNEESPPLEVWGVRARRRLAGLWERGIDHPRFLHLRLGLADLPSRYGVKVASGVDTSDADYHRLMEHDGRVATDSSVVPQLAQVPAIVDLRTHHLGIVGPQPVVDDVATELLVQLACSHSPGEVSLAALLPASETARERYDWLKWLPHARGGSMLLPARRVVAGREACQSFLRDMHAIHSEQREHRDKTVSNAYAVLVVHEAAEVDTSLLREVCELSDGLVRLVWLGMSKDTAPQVVTSLVEVSRAGDGVDPILGVLLSGDPTLRKRLIDIKGFTIVPRGIARFLAPLYDPRASGANAGVPAWLPLTAAIPIAEPMTADVPRPLIGKNLPVPLGMSETGLFTLDLVTDGPHTLIGGTTGSGKSELLQTLVCALVGLYSPAEVSLLLVDFKGGATFSAFEGLPHVVGYVSDLDQSNANRALAFLRAELRRRAVEFAKADNAKDYRQYLDRALAKGETRILPRLVVVFDEFATLVQEFEKATMATVIDIAQRGRSWGVHLILATQQPTRDVVVPKVRANVTARIALRTLASEDSNTIIDRPDAARIPRSLRGRALLRAEVDALTEFQTAYGGTRYEEREGRRLVGVEEFDVAVAELPEEGLREDSPERTQLAHAIALVRAADAKPSPGAVHMPRRLEDKPWRPVRLKQAAHRSDAADDSQLRLRLGLRDLPALQTQNVVEVDLRRGGVCFTGPNGSGRTWALAAVAELFAAAHADQAGAEAGIVAVDGANSLTELLCAHFDHAVSISLTRLDEVTRLIDQLWLVLRSRLSPQGGQADEPEIGYTRTGPILFMIDGFDLLARALGNSALAPWAGKLVEILSTGRRCGIHTALATRDSRDLDNALTASQDLIVALHAQYADGSTPPEDRLPGFGHDVAGHLVQLFTPSPEPERRRLDAHLADFLGSDGWRRPNPLRPTAPGVVRLGRDEITRTDACVDLRQSHMLVIGGPRSGRSSLLRAVAQQLAAPAGLVVPALCPKDTLQGDALRVLSIDEIKELARLDRAASREFFDRLRVCRLDDGRVPLVVDDAYAIAALPDGPLIDSTLRKLHAESSVQLIAATTAQQVGGSQVTVDMKMSGTTVYLRPKASMSEVDEGYRVRGMRLRHRPGVSYDSRDALVHTDESQLTIHLPRWKEAP